MSKKDRLTVRGAKRVESGTPKLFYPKRRMRRLLPAFAVVALCGLIYLPTARYSLVWDDTILITNNRHLRTNNPLSFFNQGFMLFRAGEDEGKNQYYRPLVVMSLWLDHKFTGDKPSGYHLTNVILNIIAGIMVVLVLGELFSSVYPAILGGAVFALHPMHVESVAFVSGRTDIMLAIFMLLGFWALLKFRAGEKRTSVEDRRGLWLAVVLVSFVAGLLSKEAAITLPVLALVYQGSYSGWLKKRESGMFMLMALLAVAFLIVRTMVVKGFAQGYEGVTAVQRVLLVVNGMGRYLFASLVPFFHRTMIADVMLFTRPSLFTLLGIGALVGLPWLALRYRTTLLGLGAAWFLLFMLPASNVFFPGASYFAERLVYLPVFGLIVSAAYLIQRFVHSPTTKRVVALAVATFCLGMLANSVMRMPLWENPMRLYTQLVREVPNAAQTRELLASALREKGDLKAAADEYRRALMFEPESPSVQENLGVVFGQAGILDSALFYTRRLLVHVPNRFSAYNNMGIIQELLQRPDSAKYWYWKAIRQMPEQTEAYNNLIRLFERMGRSDSASVVQQLLRRVQ